MDSYEWVQPKNIKATSGDRTYLTEVLFDSNDELNTSVDMSDAYADMQKRIGDSAGLMFIVHEKNRLPIHELPPMSTALHLGAKFQYWSDFEIADFIIHEHEEVQTTVMIDGTFFILMFRRWWALLDPSWHDQKEHEELPEPWVDEEVHFKCTISKPLNKHNDVSVAMKVLAISIPTEDRNEAV